ncbi:23S rRNA methyluridine methyltransferase [Sodalis praecaptivus]|uniref:23S rRNA (uracil(747)-C(5))-methyltransferase RlmC n=1 Tax=Sodalis praecaptivus TaxID=1239307 RepID=W0HV04_9GAMM|nr:23S rRNA (uracil(747)-C(5))-methyltransferase RlmC [Sodalis praecaptivus]AHF77691.1 23S rRNA methyluridine methyltransferase [Sodalis praecaptivus]
MHCELFTSERCRSCQWLAMPYGQQLAEKQRRLAALLPAVPDDGWQPAMGSAPQGMRNKAKMVVSGSVERPLLGIADADGGVDLCACPLYPASFAPVFAVVKQFIPRAGLTPYHVARRRGELKFLLLTESRHDGAMMLRFVLRSEAKLAQLRAALPWLQARLPQLRVISVNLQPVPMAVLEGEREIVLTPDRALEERLNQVPLYIRPKSFFQTNPQVAAGLYATARDWVAALPVTRLWDLFCGVGCFGLHLCRPGMQLTGIEISAEAIASARQSAHQLGLEQVSFQALDSTQFAVQNGEAPDLVLVNPPRRGIGHDLCAWLSATAPRWILYSSCQAATLVRDLGELEDYRVCRVRLFDMFPHTAHYETLVLLERRAATPIAAG